MPRIFEYPVAVGRESIDVLGHANNREYLRWMEEAAIAHSAACGWPMARYVEIGQAWVAATHFIEYLRPALAGDVLTVFTWIAEMGSRDCRRRYAVRRERKWLARGETRWAYVDLATGRAIDIAPMVAASFEQVPDDDPASAALGWGRRR
ncbi:MAG: acyl-CoA thioesterase [Betaproteobacteria bacterium]